MIKILMNKLLLLLFLIIGLFINSCSKGEPETSGNTFTRVSHPNIAYGTKHPAQKMDIYLPAAKGPHPVVVMIHGGGWVMGDKQEYKTSNKTEALLTRDYAVVAINYRLSGVAKFPAQIQDVKAAVRFIKAKAATYNLNPNKIGAWGTSAGGHLTALLATSSGVRSLEDYTIGDTTKSSKIQAGIDWFGPTDFLKMDEQAIAQGCGATSANHNQANSPESQLMGFPIQTKPSITQTANPITYVSTDDSPLYIVHGTEDCTVPKEQGTILFDAILSKMIIPVQLGIFGSSGHGTGTFEKIETVNKMIDFLDKYLK
jgi:acetyl esterase/lipase